jgi:N-acetylglucosamine kinase-like BadF-type ATPase
VGIADDLSTAIYAPTITNERIAGFARDVIETAASGDTVARSIITAAGKELGRTTVAVIRKLHMENDRFQVAYVGGIFSAGELIIAPLREEIELVAKKAFIAPPSSSPTIAAARMARALVSELALAV